MESTGIDANASHGRPRLTHKKVNPFTKPCATIFR